MSGRNFKTKTTLLVVSWLSHIGRIASQWRQNTKGTQHSREMLHCTWTRARLLELADLCDYFNDVSLCHWIAVCNQRMVADAVKISVCGRTLVIKYLIMPTWRLNWYLSSRYFFQHYSCQQKRGLLLVGSWFDGECVVIYFTGYK